eukprot:13977744-Alexandrium_andersonii.AAC.1
MLPRPDAVAVGKTAAIWSARAFHSAVGQLRRGPRNQLALEARRGRSGRGLAGWAQPGGGVGSPVARSEQAEL